MISLIISHCKIYNQISIFKSLQLIFKHDTVHSGGQKTHLLIKTLLHYLNFFFRQPIQLINKLVYCLKILDSFALKSATRLDITLKAVC